jgi:hypothetical protein
MWYSVCTTDLSDLRECEAPIKAIQCDTVCVLLIYQISESARHCLKQRGHSVKLTTHLHLPPILTSSGALPLHLHTPLRLGRWQDCFVRWRARAQYLVGTWHARRNHVLSWTPDLWPDSPRMCFGLTTLRPYSTAITVILHRPAWGRERHDATP